MCVCVCNACKLYDCSYIRCIYIYIDIIWWCLIIESRSYYLMLDCIFDVFWCHLIFLIVLQPHAFSELSLLLTTCQYHHLAAGGNRKNQKLEQYLENDRKAGNLWNGAALFPDGIQVVLGPAFRFVSHRSMLRRLWKEYLVKTSNSPKNNKKQGWYTKTNFHAFGT